MCMIISPGQKLQVAENDIECYKLLRVENEKYLTPIMRVDVDVTKPLIAKGDLVTFDNNDATIVEGGIIHCLKNNVEEQLFDIMFFNKEYSLWMCRIPKGTEYLVDCSEKQIGAKQIEFVEEIERITRDYFKMNIKICKPLKEINVKIKVLPNGETISTDKED